MPSKRNKIVLLLFIILFFSTLSSSSLLINAKEKEFDDNSNYEIKKLRKQLNEKFLIVSSMEDISSDELMKYYVSDIKILIGMEIRLFYSMGKIHGYLVFINNNNDYAIVSSANLKLILSSNDYNFGTKNFFITISKDNFKKLILARGDNIIAFPIQSLKYGDLLKKGTIVRIEAECFHLKTSSELYIF